MGKLEGKVAIVTGAGSGMGEAIALRFAEEGAKVVLADVNEDTVNNVAKQIESNSGKAVAVKMDVTSQEDIDMVVKKAVDEFGSLDILVNNAGIMDNFVPVGELEDSLWSKVMDINLNGPVKLCRAAIKHMKNQKDGGVIINNASVGGLFGARGGAAYVASKHGLVGLTKNLAATHGAFDNIRANAIAPGAINTNIGSTITAPNEMGMKAMENVGPPESTDPINIANVAVFLASDDSKFVNGIVIQADGGWTAG